MSDTPKPMTAIKIPDAPALVVKFPEIANTKTIIYRVLVIPKANVKRIRIKV